MGLPPRHGLVFAFLIWRFPCLPGEHFLPRSHVLLRHGFPRLGRGRDRARFDLGRSPHPRLSGRHIISLKKNGIQCLNSTLTLTLTLTLSLTCDPKGAGIPVFSGLHVPPGDDWKIYYTKLNSRFSKCRVMIVFLSKAFYHSLNCLNEVNEALGCKKVTKIIPVVFESDLPGADDQWPSIQPEQTEQLQQLTTVQGGLGKLNYFPARGTLLDNPQYVAELLQIVQSHLQ